MLFVTQAMGDDSDARGQTTADSVSQEKTSDEYNGATLVQENPTEQSKVPEDNSNRQGQVTEDSSGQAKSIGEFIDQELNSANHSLNAGVSEPFVFWRHVPPPTLCLPPRLLPYDYYSRVPPPVLPSLPIPPTPPPPPPNGVFPALWNGTPCGIWPVPAPQVAVGVLPTPPPEVDSSPKHYTCSDFTEVHDATPMEISPSASPIPPSTTTSTEGETPAPSEKAENTTDETCEVSSSHSMKPSGPQNGVSVTRALKPVKYSHADDPRLAESSVLSLLKRCMSCAKKMALAKRKGIAYVAEECSCSKKFLPSNVERESTASTTKSEPFQEKLEKPIDSAVSAAARQQAATDADTPMTSCESNEPSLASVESTQPAYCVSQCADKLTEKTQPVNASCTERKPGSEESKEYLIPVVQGRRAQQRSWQRRRTTSCDTYAAIDKGPDNGETFSNCSYNNHVPAEYLVNRFIEEIRAASEQVSCASDNRVKVKITGVYVPGPKVDNLQTTVIDMEMDPLLGACVEHAEGPFMLPSELEEDDEGWLWTFE
ncbi:hypothetical protein HPB50_025381 [Hyalomma asiaticum]|uniref:Uncharacterized protein n=1 Tax=Hyalomma asiaticum TaxID=266040 RepID=A0ACB7S5D2_HYAAI|nr:hypothetical protein HPB50_025381 [Hyalomma asiaticum]